MATPVQNLLDNFARLRVEAFAGRVIRFPPPVGAGLLPFVDEISDFFPGPVTAADTGFIDLGTGQRERLADPNLERRVRNQARQIQRISISRGPLLAAANRVIANFLAGVILQLYQSLFLAIRQIQDLIEEVTQANTEQFLDNAQDLANRKEQEILQRLRAATPVDTGRARQSWINAEGGEGYSNQCLVAPGYILSFSNTAPYVQYLEQAVIEFDLIIDEGCRELQDELGDLYAQQNQSLVQNFGDVLVQQLGG